MSDNLPKDHQVVYCDMCTEDNKQPAQKTCMKCEISMCVQHLQAHLTTPVLLQTHPLTEPIASGNGGLVVTTKCPQHGKLLEYYCLDDFNCVCVSCAIEDQHRLHNMKTFSTAHKELLEKVQAEQQALLVKADGANTSLEKWEKNEREKLGRSSVRLIEAVTNLRDLALTRVQSSVSARMVSIKTSKSSLKAAKSEKDTFRFLQMCSQVNQDLENAKAVDFRKGLEPGSDRNKLVEEITQRGEKMMEQVSNFWGSLLTHVDPENHQEISAVTSNLYFDSETLGQGMTLSKDGRKVFNSGELEKKILLIQGMSSRVNSYRWGISLSKDYDWTIGLCDKKCAINLQRGDIFGLCWKGNKLSAVTKENAEGENTVPMQLNKRGRSRRVSSQVISHYGEDVGEQIVRPEKVEVIWSCPNSLSFYNLIGQHQRRKIVTLTIGSTNQDLTPFVCLEMELQDSPVDLFGVGFVYRSHAQQQQQWKCSCGRVNVRNQNPYDYGGQKSSPNICACGKVIYFSHITEVLCELF
ncbi:tripartite motif-containing protein 16-like [Labrus mixtus]|uniref:tripartite motif-containing protein 16-like n=1 Tax=Labrus mixtus TaxID=508554 RepID=UPI0029C0D451|nr:tripartite motif-containing protein 16-like [Labrus mixtus]